MKQKIPVQSTLAPFTILFLNNIYWHVLFQTILINKIFPLNESPACYVITHFLSSVANLYVIFSYFQVLIIILFSFELLLLFLKLKHRLFEAYFSFFEI